MLLAAVFAAAAPPPLHCDVLVVGGSTAAFAAAITAAEADPGLSVCLTEPTDWVGGQLSASGVSAIDFGAHNSMPENQPRSFRQMLQSLTASVPPQCAPTPPPSAAAQPTTRRLAAAG